MLKFMVYTGLLAQPLTYNEYNCTLKIWRGHDSTQLHTNTTVSVC